VSGEVILDVDRHLSGGYRAARSRAGYRRMMASVWHGGGTLAVEQAEPLATGSAKVLPLHVAGGAALVG